MDFPNTFCPDPQGKSIHPGLPQLPEMKKKYKVLLTDGHWAKTLAAARSLGSRGIQVTIGESTWIATAFFSRFCSRRWVYPSPFFYPDHFLDSLIKELKNNSYDALISMEEQTTLLITRHRSRLEPYTSIPFHDYETIDRARRKDEIIKLAMELGIPAPKTWFPGDLEEALNLVPGIPIPAVIKPRIGSGSTGIVYVNRPEELGPAYHRVHRKYPLPLIQEFIPAGGEAVGASFLFGPDSTPLASFTHRRLREYPVSGGPSTLRESIDDPRARQYGETMLKALHWYGVAMVEFRYDPRDGQPKLLEVNPRFWGSLPLAIFAGVDFPYLLFRLALELPIEKVAHYALGKRCRWILPGDLLHFIKNPNRFHLKPSFFHFFDPDTAHDFFSAKDPLPVLGRVLSLLNLVYDQDMKRLMKDRTDPV